jgi:DNA-binding transcriptional ArsR family regulator
VKRYFRKMLFAFPDGRQSSIATLHALAHPTRLRILGHLQLHGDATATECAAEVDESPASCSYHLRTLARHGLIEEVPSDDGRERRWRRAVLSVDWDAGAKRDEEFQAASAAARGAMLEVSDAYVRDYLATERDFSPAWREAAAFLQLAVVATPEELEQMVRRVQDVFAEYMPGARETTPPGARHVRVSVRAVPGPETA